MGLFCLFSKKKNVEKKKNKNKNYSGESLDRLTKDGKLPFGWYQKNKEFTDKIESEHRIFVEEYVNSRNKSPKERYSALKSLVQHTDDVRKLCASKGECFAYWSTALFGDKDFEELKNELKYLKDHYVELEEKYKMDQIIQSKIIPELKRKLPKIIKQNPGILQTDVYKMFPDEYKSHISSELYYMERNRKIERQKHGRTYSLIIK